MNPNNQAPGYDPNMGYSGYAQPSSSPYGNSLFNKKFLIASGVVATLLITFLVWLNAGRSGSLELSAPTKTPNNTEVAVKIKEQNGDEKELKLQPGETKKVRLAKGNVRVDAAADNLKAIDVVAIEGRKTTALTTPSGEQRTATQLGSDALGCPIIVNSVTYSYNCGADGIIRKHTRTALGTSANSTLFDSENFSILEPYKNGLLGLRVNGDDKTLVYVDLAANKVQPVSLPDAVKRRLKSGTQIVVTKDPSNPRFILSFSFDNIYLFKDMGDMNPTEIKLGEGVALDDLKRARTVSFNKDTIVIYSGQGKDPHDGEDESTEHKDKQTLRGYIFQYDTSGKLQQTLYFPEGTTSDLAYKLTDNYYASTSITGFEVYYAEGANLRLVYDLFDTSSWTIQDSKAYIQNGGTIYEFTPGQKGTFSLHGIFSSPTINVSELFGTSAGLLFSGMPANDTTGGLKIYTLANQAAQNSSEQAAPIVQGEPSYSGFDELIDVGVRAEQVDSLKIAIGKYITSTNKPVPKVRVSEVGAVIHSRTSSTDTATFTLTVGDKVMDAKMEYSGQKTIRLYLSEQLGSKQQIFDSGTITP